MLLLGQRRLMSEIRDSYIFALERYRWVLSVCLEAVRLLRSFLGFVRQTLWGASRKGRVAKSANVPGTLSYRPHQCFICRPSGARCAPHQHIIRTPVSSVFELIHVKQ
jgi:hypothetical protein